MKSLISYLATRPDATTFLLPTDLERALRELFPRAEGLLPEPYKIFPADETQPAVLGFPVAEALVVLIDACARLIAPPLPSMAIVPGPLPMFMAVAVALIRGFTRNRTDRIGNFWVDLVRGCVRILLPIAVAGTIVLLALGAVQNFSSGTRATTLLFEKFPCNNPSPMVAYSPNGFFGSMPGSRFGSSLVSASASNSL